MNKIGPTLFCFALFCTMVPFLFPGRSVMFLFVGWTVIGAVSLAWGTHLLVQRRVAGMFFLLLGMCDLLFLFPLIHHFQD
jgi:hypothetical protein